MPSNLHKNLNEGGHEWLRCNIDPKKAGAIINMQEQMIESRVGKRNRGMHIDSDKCRLCEKCVEGVMHLVSECQMHAGNEYLKKHKNALKVLMTA